MFIFIVKDEQDKLQPKAKIGQLLTYDEEIKGYHCWVLKERKIIIIRNVRFDESTIVQKDRYSLVIPSSSQQHLTSGVPKATSTLPPFMACDNIISTTVHVPTLVENSSNLPSITIISSLDA